MRNINGFVSVPVSFAGLQTIDLQPAGQDPLPLPPFLLSFLLPFLMPFLMPFPLSWRKHSDLMPDPFRLRSPFSRSRTGSAPRS